MVEPYVLLAQQLRHLCGHPVCVGTYTFGFDDEDVTRFFVWSSKLQKFFIGATMDEAEDEFHNALQPYPAAQRLLDEAATEAMKGE